MAKKLLIRHLLVLSALAAVTLSAMAGPREDTLDGISRCSMIVDDRAFLDCIYGAAQPLRASLGLSPAPANQQRLVPPAAGYALPRLASTSPPRVVPAVKPVGVVSNILGGDNAASWMEAFSFDKHGLFTVTFSNGQVWRQDTGDTARAHWNGRASDFSIKLAVDATGRSGQMMVRGDAATYQVHKLR